MQTRRSFLTGCAGVAALSLVKPVLAQALPLPFVVYDDELKNGWQNWSWAKVALSVAAGGAKPMRIQGDPWTALALHHDAFSTAGMSRLTFNVNGGVEGGQSLSVKALVDGKPVDSHVVIKPAAKQWALAAVSLKELGVEGKTIDGIWIQGQANPYSAYYVTRVQFE